MPDALGKQLIYIVRCLEAMWTHFVSFYSYCAVVFA